MSYVRAAESGRSGVRLFSLPGSVGPVLWKVPVMKSSRVATPVVAAIAACFAAMLSGCSLFGPDEAPAGSTPVTVEEGGGVESDVTDAQRQSDVESCREQARAVVNQDSNISADIDSRDSQGAFWDDSSDLTRNMDDYDSRRRYYRIFEECMQGRGYGGTEE